MLGKSIYTVYWNQSETTNFLWIECAWMSPILCKNTWNTNYSMYKKCERNIMCTGHRKYTWNCALYCIRKFPGNVQISCSKKCTYHEPRNVTYPTQFLGNVQISCSQKCTYHEPGDVTYPTQFLGFPNQWNSKFLPVPLDLKNLDVIKATYDPHVKVFFLKGANAANMTWYGTILSISWFLK